MYRRFFIITYLSFWFGTQLLSQDLSETNQLADKLFADQRYEPALKLYHRIAYFGGDSISYIVYPRIAECYFKSGDYNRSIFFYDLSVNTSGDDSLKIEYQLSSVLCYYLLEQYDFALQTLYAMGEPNTQFQRKRYYFYLGLVSIKKNEPEQALQHFLEVVDNPEAREIIKKDFASARLNKPKSSIATGLSIFVPGLGQLYSGDYKNAVNSFILTGALAVLTYHIAVTYSIGDAILSTTSWLQRYYLGGFTRAGAIAAKRRIEKRENLLNRTLSVIEIYNIAE